MVVMEPQQILSKLTIPASNRYVSVQNDEGEFMRQWVLEHHLQRTLEVGFAYGASAAWILSAHEGMHTCMDPFQEEAYENQGLRNIEALGFRDRLEFHPGYSHDVLPRLLAEQRSFDFAFIDGAHLYDAILVDFYFVDRLLVEGGYVLFHDAWMRGTQLVASFIRRNRADYCQIRTPLKNLTLFQKTGTDNRQWHHFHEFYTLRSYFSHRLVVWLLKRGLLQKFCKG